MPFECDAILNTYHARCIQSIKIKNGEKIDSTFMNIYTKMHLLEWPEWQRSKKIYSFSSLVYSLHLNYPTDVNNGMNVWMTN